MSSSTPVADEGPEGTTPGAVPTAGAEPVVVDDVDSGAAEQTAPTPLSLKARIRTMAETRLPQGSRGREVAKAGLTTYREVHHLAERLRDVWSIPGVIEPGEPSYRSWLRSHEASPQELENQSKQAQRLVDPVSVSVVVLPAEGPDGGDAVDRTVRALEAQSWGAWTATVVGARPARSDDDRVQHAAADGGSVVAAANAAVEQSAGTLVIVLRAGDVLAPDCFYQVATAAHRDPLVDLVTWDDDVRPVGADLKVGRVRRPVAASPRDPLFRPSWSPEVLLGNNYVGRAFAMRRGRFLAIGGLDATAGSALHWDLLLRAELEPERVTARGPHPRRPAGAPRRASGGRRCGGAAGAGPARLAGPRPRQAGTGSACGGPMTDWPTVTVVDPHPAQPADAGDGACRRWPAPTTPSSTWSSWTTAARRRTTRRGTRHRERRLRPRVLWWTEAPFNYSAVNNAAARTPARDAGLPQRRHRDASTRLDEGAGGLGPPARRSASAGLQLIGPDGEIQHTGVVLGLGGFADHVFEGMRPGSDSIYGPTDWYRNVLAVTGACFAVEREVFEELGGFDERFMLCGSDVALGLDAVAGGLAQRLLAVRGDPAPGVGDPWDQRPGRGLLRELLALQHLAVRRRPVLLPTSRSAAGVPQLRARTSRPRSERVSVPLGRAFTPSGSATTPPSRGCSPTCAGRCRSTWPAIDDLHARERRAVRGPDHQLVHPRHRQPVLRRHQHRAADRRLPRPRCTACRTGSSCGAARRTTSSARRWPRRSRRWPTREIDFYDGPQASLRAVPEADAAIATLWVTALRGGARHRA